MSDLSVFEINSVNVGSTGKIMLQIADAAKKEKINVFAFCPDCRSNRKNKKQNSFLFGCRLERILHLFCSRLTGLFGLGSVGSTIHLISQMNKKKCGLIHLHNIHGDYINYPLFFGYVKRKSIPIVWTLHDCWSFTGRCPHFVMTKCDKWKEGCHNCYYPKNSYPQSKIDTSRLMWKLKKKWFTGIENCTIVTPSQWLADLVKQSFLKDYPVKVINNGIDLFVFKPVESDFREKYNLNNKKVVLGVAFGWGIRKGFDVFVELSRRLPDNYQIILVGMDNNIDKQLPANIISIHRTQNQTELAEIYTAADVFVNPTREENYPTVNIEAIACGTPVVTFRTGGSPEIPDETCGSVVDCNDIDAMEIEIRRICEEHPYSKEACLKRALNFDMNARFEEYVELYNEMIE